MQYDDFISKGLQKAGVFCGHQYIPIQIQTKAVMISETITSDIKLIYEINSLIYLYFFEIPPLKLHQLLH